MPSRLPTPGMTLTGFIAIRPMTLPNGDVTAFGDNIDPFRLVGIKHLSALMPKYLLPTYDGDPSLNYTKAWYAEASDLTDGSPGVTAAYQQHDVAKGELATAIYNF